MSLLATRGQGGSKQSLTTLGLGSNSKIYSEISFDGSCVFSADYAGATLSAVPSKRIRYRVVEYAQFYSKSVSVVSASPRTVCFANCEFSASIKDVKSSPVVFDRELEEFVFLLMEAA